MTFLPLAGALALLVLPAGAEKSFRAVALAVSLATFAISLLLWTRFDQSDGGFQLVHAAPWIPEYGIEYKVGLDTLLKILQCFDLSIGDFFDETSRANTVLEKYRQLSPAAQKEVESFIEFKKNHFYVRQLRDAKIKPMVEIMRPGNLRNYASACGWALARAHKRTAVAVMLTGYLGTSTAFEDAMAAFAARYADRNELDPAVLVAAVRAGRLEARTDA